MQPKREEEMARELRGENPEKKSREREMCAGEPRRNEARHVRKIKREGECAAGNSKLPGGKCNGVEKRMRGGSLMNGKCRLQPNVVQRDRERWHERHERCRERERVPERGYIEKLEVERE